MNAQLQQVLGDASSLAWAAGVSFVGAALLTAWARRAAFGWGMLDHPNARSSHDRPIPRTGGLAVFLATMAGVVSVGSFDRLSYVAFFLGLAGITAVGFRDDRRALSPLARFVFQTVLAAFFVGFAGGIERLPLPASADLALGFLGKPLAVVWIVAVVNFYNFLDGIDGLAGLQAVITGLGIAAVGFDGLATVAGVALAGASLGFLLHNWSPARVFLGDAGSGLMGFAFAALPLLAPAESRGAAVVFVATCLFFFLADAVFTLARRIARGARFYEAHREHLYQRLVVSGLSHATVASGLGAAAALVTTAALALGAAVGLLVASALFLGEVGLVAWRGASSPVRRARWRQALIDLGYRLGRGRYALLLLLDSAVIACAFYTGFLVRFEGRIPPDRLAEFPRYLPLLLAIRLPLHFAFGLHRWSFRLSGLHEAARIVLATATGTAFFAASFYFLQRRALDVTVGPPRAVIAIEFLVTTALLLAMRFSPRFTLTWLHERRLPIGGFRIRALIVGAGSAGDLLLRDLQRSAEHAYEVVGFVDDDPGKRGISIGGRPVLGSLADIPALAARRGVRELLFAIPRLPAARVREVLQSCEGLKLGYKILPVSFAYLSDRVSVEMLQALAPEDLLPRHEVEFDDDELKALVRARGVLVTGAAGSIGSEICRQLSSHGPRRLVLVDINENGLYFLYRQLKDQWPEVEVRAEVADIRDRDRLFQLLREYRPEDVFHAAAHKHVPLMEYAPEEAVKNNVAGCRHIVAAAREAGVERFVLISSDKAVEPSSVMGASKRICEMLIRAEAASSRTRFTAVRFGNVLGSAGSVVPLFKAQIAAGGPVSVTHPEMRRYLMTIPEAVGLVLLSGLSDYADLCVLDMGEPIRILDLARLMITGSGLIPDRDIEIKITGLRPGEKLDERLMTEEEEKRSILVRPRIRGVSAFPPPAGFAAGLDRLEALAAAGDRAGVREALGRLVPTYVPTMGTEEIVSADF
jgi:FlaA1/EpsC-like NDP-sugar epimerase/UDP-N-acetylmuramyl pentapeptide phosphotransferase/UDP-N-acetylglucosamine-1-phosphate transferase